MHFVINYLPYFKFKIKNIVHLYNTQYSTNFLNAKAMNLTDVIKVLEKFSPTKFAADWDNVGLIIEPSSSQEIKNILLTNDLTLNVVDEAIEKNANLILSYHPPIFRGLKSINQSNVRGKIVSLCIENKIAVYSPHTVYDIIRDGVNDWLIRPLTDQATKIEAIKSSNSLIQYGNYFGEGRIMHFSENNLTISKIIGIIKEHLNMKMLRLALGRKHDLDSPISCLACCAGSGSNVLQDVAADLYLTGEMSHHDILDATERGVSVLLTEHSNSERGYLVDVVMPKLDEALGGNICVTVSRLDKDPVEIV